MQFSPTQSVIKTTGQNTGFWAGGAADSAKIKRRIARDRMARLENRTAKICKPKSPLGHVLLFLAAIKWRRRFFRRQSAYKSLYLNTRP